MSVESTALEAIDDEIERARQEVGRLVRVARANAEDLCEDASDVGTAWSPMWRPSEDQLALHSARVRLAALKSAWVAVARRFRRQRGPDGSQSDV